MINYPVEPPDWRFYWFWAIAAVSAAAVVPTIAYLVGETIGRIWAL